MRLIDADELKDRMAIIINSAIDGDETADQLKLLSMIKYVLDTSVNETPTIEAEPVRHSRWVNINNSSEYFCEDCGCSFKLLSYVRGDYEHCPKCGAIMDTEEEA